LVVVVRWVVGGGRREEAGAGALASFFFLSFSLHPSFPSYLGGRQADAVVLLLKLRLCEGWWVGSEPRGE
jgi:hypothetical protein